MLSGIYSAASALKTADVFQDVIATNLAHMNVPGFRRSDVSISSFANALAAQDAANVPNGEVVTESLAVDFTPGPIVATGQKLDVALDGDGFFVVQGESEELYTRNGALQRNADGLLVGTHGMPVLGEGGPITLPGDIPSSQVTIARDGSISIAGTYIDKLKLAGFADNAVLTPVGTTLFSSGTANPLATEARVVQGVREQSNVSPVDELVTMIVALRYHEAAQKTLSTLDRAVENQTSPQG